MSKFLKREKHYNVTMKKICFKNLFLDYYLIIDFLSKKTANINIQRIYITFHQMTSPQAHSSFAKRGYKSKPVFKID